MKLEIKFNKVKALNKYPYIGIKEDSGAIVLFIFERTGTTLIDGKYNKAGKFSTNWAESEFTPFNGTITLSND